MATISYEPYRLTWNIAMPSLTVTNLNPHSGSIPYVSLTIDKWGNPLSQGQFAPGTLTWWTNENGYPYLALVDLNSVEWFIARCTSIPESGLTPGSGIAFGLGSPRGFMDAFTLTCQMYNFPHPVLRLCGDLGKATYYGAGIDHV